MTVSLLRLNRGVLALTACVVLGIGTRAQAAPEISFVSLFRTSTNTQTGNGNALTSTGSYFNATLTSAQPNDFNTVQLIYPGAGSPTNIAQQDPSIFSFSSSTFPDQATMDASYPTGSYQFNASGVGGSASTTISYLTDHYPGSLPFLTGTDFTNLQGMNAGASFDFHFSPYVTGGQATESFLFFTIFDNTTSSLIYNLSFQPATTTGTTLAANTLTAGHSYTYELIFSNRDLVASPGANFDAVLGFDQRTTGQFTTAAAPEPGTLVLLAVGCIGIVAGRRRSVKAGGD
ncbi:MAG: PEP-CTERM sorting domain-containing protein [Armatimonas sp.]